MRLDPVDRLLLGFLAALAGVASTFVPHPFRILTVLGAMLFGIVAPLAAIVFSTVYLSFHYVTDVIGGIALATAVVCALPEIRRRVGLDSARPLVDGRADRLRILRS